MIAFRLSVIVLVLLLTLMVSISGAEQTYEPDIIPPDHPGPLHFRGYICEKGASWDGEDLSDGGCWGNGMTPIREDHEVVFSVEGVPIASKPARDSDGFYNFRYEGPIKPQINFGVRLQSEDQNFRISEIQTNGHVIHQKSTALYSWSQWCCVTPPEWPWLGLEIKHVTWTNWIVYTVYPTATPTVTPTTTLTPTASMTPTPYSQWFPLYYKTEKSK